MNHQFEVTINGAACDVTVKEQLPRAPRSSLHRSAVPVLTPASFAAAPDEAASAIMPKIPYTFRLTALDGSALPAPAEERPAPAAAPPAPKPVYQPAAPASAAPPAPQAAPAAASGGERITAPMPGTILTLNVEPGASVQKGDVLLSFEAMKMENEILAPCSGTVLSVDVSLHSTIDTGSVLCVIAADS